MGRVKAVDAPTTRLTRTDHRSVGPDARRTSGHRERSHRPRQRNDCSVRGCTGSCCCVRQRRDPRRPGTRSHVAAAFRSRFLVPYRRAVGGVDEEWGTGMGVVVSAHTLRRRDDGCAQGLIRQAPVVGCCPAGDVARAPRCRPGTRRRSSKWTGPERPPERTGRGHVESAAARAHRAQGARIVYIDRSSRIYSPPFQERVLT